MRFEDVVQNGVLQAFGRAPRCKRGKLVPLERARRLLHYKMARVTRSMVRASGKLHIIFD